MRRLNAELLLKNSLKFTQSCLGSSFVSAPTQNAEQSDEFNLEENDCFGGIIKNGQLGWIAKGPLFEVFCLKSGRKVTSFRFDKNLGFEKCFVTSVAEINILNMNFCILAVCIQLGDASGSIVVLCSVQELSKIIRCIQIREKITNCYFVKKEIARRTIFQIYDGCLAIGTDNGCIILLDLNLKKCEEVMLNPETDEEDIDLVPTYIVENENEFHYLKQHYQRAKEENCHFAIQLETIDNPSLVLSITPIVNILSLAVGLEDGRLLLYDLSELQIFCVIEPTLACKSSPLVKLAYMEPSDDPRACIYLMAFHENSNVCMALMYSIMYGKRIVEDDGVCLFEEYQACTLRLALELSTCGGVPITCQSIFKQSPSDEESSISLCLLGWKQQNTTRLILFDMNQWYKEQLPSRGNADENESFLASFSLKECNALDMFIDTNNITTFNSIKRLEEHFYPISLNFDCVVLQQNGCTHMKWPGLQNRALDIFKSGGALAILEPAPYFSEIIRASLMPQFVSKTCDYRRLSSQSQHSDDGMDTSIIMQNCNSMYSINDQRHILLSVALEYNCFGLLKECALSWADGSHIGRKPSEGLSLSTLTDWIWKRSENVHKRCNTIYIPLFDHSGLKIDNRTKKELSNFLHQLKILSDLMDIILRKCKQYIPNETLETLSNQHNSIRIAFEYHEIVQWLLNIGLLPEGIPISSKNIDDNIRHTLLEMNFVSYPYKILKNFYTLKRKNLTEISKVSDCNRTGGCRLLYIDAFIEHECNSNAIKDQWIECGGNGLYPPPSLQAMLRIMLIPDISLENKYIILIYLFLDLNMAVECESQAAILQNLIKFPAVFKLNASLIKTVQAFWSLDHGQFELALEELISPFSQNRKLSQWQKELLVETLLTQDQPSLALRALQIPSAPIFSLLELKTLLSNDLVAEAFHLQRTKNDPELFRQFLTGCFCLGKLCVLRDLAFIENESKILEEFLKDIQSVTTENLHFVHLLQKSKYIDAISYFDELSLSKQQNNCRITDLETPNFVLSAYNLTMTPVIKQLSNIYYDIRNKIKVNDLTTIEPLPLSSQLIQRNANKLPNDIYHNSILGIDQVTSYWNETLYKDKNRLLDTNNVPFVRSSQINFIPIEIGNYRDTISYPDVYKVTQKRKLQSIDGHGDDNDDSESHDSFQDCIISNPRKRRRITDNTSLLRDDNLNVSLLTKFKQKKDLLENTVNSENIFKNLTNSKQSSVNKKVSIILNTPIIKSTLNELRNGYESGADDRSRTPQSILKGKGGRRSCTPAKVFAKRRLIVDEKDQETIDEERSIRFDLPEDNDNEPNSRSISTFSNTCINNIEQDNKINDIEMESINKICEDRLRDTKSLKRAPLHRSEAISSFDSSDHHLHVQEEIEKIEHKIDIPLWGEVPKFMNEEDYSYIQPVTVSKVSRSYISPQARKPIRSASISNSGSSEIYNKSSAIQTKAVIEASIICQPPENIIEVSSQLDPLKKSESFKTDKSLEMKEVDKQEILLCLEPEKMQQKTFALSEKPVNEMFIIETSEIVERSEITFDPPISSSKYLENLASITSSPITEFCKETITIDDSSDNSSITEEENTILNVKPTCSKAVDEYGTNLIKTINESVTYKDITFTNSSVTSDGIYLKVSGDNETTDEKNQPLTNVEGSKQNDYDKSYDNKLSIKNGTEEIVVINEEKNAQIIQNEEIVSISSSVDSSESSFDIYDDLSGNSHKSINKNEKSNVDLLVISSSSTEENSNELFLAGEVDYYNNRFSNKFKPDSKELHAEKISLLSSTLKESKDDKTLETSQTTNLVEKLEEKLCNKDLISQEENKDDKTLENYQKTNIEGKLEEQLCNKDLISQKDSKDDKAFENSQKTNLEEKCCNKDLISQEENIVSSEKNDIDDLGTKKLNMPHTSQEVKLQYQKSDYENIMEVKECSLLRQQVTINTFDEKIKEGAIQNDQNSIEIRRKSTSEDSQNINELYSFNSETPTKRTLRSTRARSETTEIIDTPIRKLTSRHTRAKSVSTDTPPLTPNRILTRRQSALLSCIDEDSILESPSQVNTPLTPTRKIRRRLNSVEKTPVSRSTLRRSESLKSLNMNDDEPVTARKRSRRSSFSSEKLICDGKTSSVLSEDNYRTPRKRTMSDKTYVDTPATDEFKKIIKKLQVSSSESNDDENNKKNVKKPKTKASSDNLTKKNITRRKKEKSVEPENKDTKTLISNDDEEKSKVSEAKKKVVRKRSLSIDITTEEESKNDDDYSSSRRLTRNQQNSIVKLKKINENLPSTSLNLEVEAVKIRKRERSTKSEEKSLHGSETESQVSTKSKKSDRVLRSGRSSVKDEDEVSSIDSNSSVKRPKSKSQNKRLTAIEEETLETVSNSGDDADKKKRGRPKKAN